MSLVKKNRLPKILEPDLITKKFWIIENDIEEISPSLPDIQVILSKMGLYWIREDGYIHLDRNFKYIVKNGCRIWDHSRPDCLTCSEKQLMTDYPNHIRFKASEVMKKYKHLIN